MALHSRGRHDRRPRCIVEADRGVQPFRNDYCMYASISTLIIVDAPWHSRRHCRRATLIRKHTRPATSLPSDPFAVPIGGRPDNFLPALAIRGQGLFLMGSVVLSICGP